MDNRPSYASQLNGSSVHSSRSVSPEPVADLPIQPLPQMFERPEERVPTPFPSPPQPIIDQPLSEIISIPSTSGHPPFPIPQHSTIIAISPTRHPLVIPQLSNSGSTSSDIPPNPLTPTVNVISHPFYGLSSSSSTSSFHGIEQLVRRLKEDRRINAEFQSRSIASGLYAFANMMLPALPEFEESVFDDLGQEEVTERRSNQESRRFIIRWCVTTGLIAAVLVGQQLGTAFYFWHIKPR